ATEYRIEGSLDGESWKTLASSTDRQPYQPGRKPVEATGKLKDLHSRRRELEARLSALEKPPMVYAGTFQQPGPTHVLKRGDPLQKLAEAEPSAIRGIGKPLRLDPKSTEQQRRIALAEWIAAPANPLPARVMANRAWHYHFGQGIV